MIIDMKRAIGVMAVLAIVTIVVAATEEDLALLGHGCPVGTDRWSTVADEYTSEFEGYPTKADAVRAWFSDGTLRASNGSILRAIAATEREGVAGAPVFVETMEGLPAVLTLERFNGAGWFVADSSWCRRRAGG
jgi:hypothetical protein